MKLSESTFKLVPEGVTTFKVVEVDDSKYEDFGKLVVKLQTAKGESHNETFTIVKANGEINEGALRAWSYFARTCLNNFQADEIDTQDIVGCYIKATVKHETYDYVKDGENKTGTKARLNDYTTAIGFDKQVSATESEVAADEDDDLDGFLDD